MRERRSSYRFMFPVFFLAAIAFFSLIVMLLWNAILPHVINASHVSYFQAAGILVLSKILFGGFPGRNWRGGRGHYQWAKMEAKWQDMNPEEREKFKADWKNRCDRRGRNSMENNIDGDNS